jgi:dihydrolipoamide dehydrogenase
VLEGIDMPKVNEYRDGVVNRLYKGLQGLVKSRNVTFVEGEGRLVAPDTVEVAGERYTGANVVLATGSVARSLPGLQIGGRIMTSDQALYLDYVPQRAIVLGGGVIGVEFASVWKSFGADVTIVEALPHLVPNEDEACSKALERAFRKRGIAFSLGVRFASAEQDEAEVRVTLEDGTVLSADVLLVAVGRGPNVPGVFAVGDITPGLQLAHRGFLHGIFVAEEVAGLAPTIVADIDIPRVTYCEPEVASVGMTEAQARDKHGNNVATYEYNLGGNGKSQILGTTGFVKLVRVTDGPVVGIHMVGARMGEQIGEAQLIVNWEAFPEDVAALVHAHPTQNEALGEAHLALAGKPLHAHA